MAESEEARPYHGLPLLHNVNSPTGVKGNVGKTKSSLLEKFPPKENERRKKVSKSTQVNSTCITDWHSVAEKRRVALDEALRENDRLCKLCESLKSERDTYEYMLEEVNNLVDVVQGLIFENADDTGIDVEDLNESARSENDDM